MGMKSKQRKKHNRIKWQEENVYNQQHFISWLNSITAKFNIEQKAFEAARKKRTDKK